MVNKVALVSVMYANNEIGSLEPIQELCNIAHRNGAKFHTDAVQAVGHVKIDVKEIGVDMMSASAHKFKEEMVIKITIFYLLDRYVVISWRF